MWTTGDRPDPRDAYAPCATEIGLTLAQAYEAGEAIDTPTNTLRSVDLDPFILASLRTDADEAAAEAALESVLIAPVEPAEVVDLAARRRRAPAIPDGVRAA
ncbi:hypothetical protein [Salinifilum ghardaiensis]